MQLLESPGSSRALLRGRSVVGKCRYTERAGGRRTSAPIPDGVVRGRLGCDAAGFLASCLGFDRYERSFLVGSGWVNADSMICEAETLGTCFRPLAAPDLGAIVAYGSIEFERDGHRDRTGHAALVVWLPERWSATCPACTALRIIHCSRGIQRRRGHAMAEIHAATWGHRALFRGVSHPYWRTRFLRYLRADPA